MKQTVNLSDFRDAFIRAGRKEQFSYEGLRLLFDYLEELDDCTGEESELDVIALCCEYAEETPEQIAVNYDIDISDLYVGDIPQAVMDYLCDNTSVVGMTNDGLIIYQQF